MSAEVQEGLELKLDPRLCVRAMGCRRAMHWCLVLGHEVLLGLIARIYNPDGPEDCGHTIETFEDDILERFSGVDFPFDPTQMAHALKVQLQEFIGPCGAGGGLASPRLHAATTICLLRLAHEMAAMFDWEDIDVVNAEFRNLYLFEQDLRSFVLKLDEATVRKLGDVPNDKPIEAKHREQAQAVVIRLLEERLSD